MTDIYRQELDIPEKAKTIGWVLLAIGTVLLILAAIFFYEESRLIQKYARPVDNVPAASSPRSEAPARSSQVTRAEQYLAMVIVAFALLMVFVVTITLSHRIAIHLREGSPKPPAKTKFSDPWQESGRRFNVPPEDG